MYRGGIIIKTARADRADGGGRRDPGALSEDAPSKFRAGRDHRRARPSRRAVHRLAGRASPRSSATEAFRARSAPRRTRWSCTGSRAPTSCAAATSSRSTSASPTRAGSPTRRSRSPVGAIEPRPQQLLDTTQAALFAAVEQARPGNHLGDVSHAVQKRVERDGLSIIRSLVGHGVGRDMHEDPQMPNYGEPGRGPELEPGMVLAIEPMVNAGGPEVRWATTTGPFTRPTARWRPIRVHGRDHRGRAPDPDPVAPGAEPEVTPPRLLGRTLLYSFVGLAGR